MLSPTGTKEKLSQGSDNTSKDQRMSTNLRDKWERQNALSRGNIYQHLSQEETPSKNGAKNDEGLLDSVKD